MALTPLQRAVCQLLAENRIASGESYVAGGVALNECLAASRISRDIDLFHDTDHALASSWRADRSLLEAHGFQIVIVRELPALIEAEVGRGSERIRIEWARDSAFRFFPLHRHDELGLTLHPFDLATNKVLALVGRLEVRDWVDVIATDERLQPLGYLAWAACGKDPGFSPASILAHAARTSRYSVDEVRELSFDGKAPSAVDLARTWHAMLESARQIVASLPPDEVGTCVLGPAGELFRGSTDELREALGTSEISFHRGRIRGAFPQVKRVG